MYGLQLAQLGLESLCPLQQSLPWLLGCFLFFLHLLGTVSTTATPARLLSLST